MFFLKVGLGVGVRFPYRTDGALVVIVKCSRLVDVCEGLFFSLNENTQYLNQSWLGVLNLTICDFK